jgi:ABC-type transport system substrate-binding protein
MAGYWERVTSSRMSRRRAIMGAAGLGAGAIALSMVGCGGDDEETRQALLERLREGQLRTWEAPDETKDAVPGGIYKGVRTSELGETLHPIQSVSTAATNAYSQSYERMMSRESGPGIDPQRLDRAVQGNIVESVEQSNDGLTYTFKIRPNYRFHNVAPVNGRAADVDDIRYAFEAFMAGPRAGNLRPILDKLEYPDSRTFVLKTQYPFAEMLDFMTSTPTPHVIPKEGFTGGFDLATKVIGTGFAEFVAYDPAIAYRYKKHNQFWRTGKPYIDQWFYPIVTEYAQRYAQFLVGNTLEITPVQRDVLQLRREAPNTVMFRNDPSGSREMIWFGQVRLSESPWRDLRVRQAMSMLIDRDLLRAHFSDRPTFAAAGITIEDRWHTDIQAVRQGLWLDPQKNELGESSKYYHFNEAEARRLIQATGFQTPIELPVSSAESGHPYGANYPVRRQLTFDMWEKSGLFKVRHIPLRYADFFQDYRNWPLPFEGVSLGPSGALVSADLDMHFTHRTGGDGFKGMTGTPEQARIDDMIDRQRREFDFSKRQAIVHEFQKYSPANAMFIIQNDGVSQSFTFKQPWLRNTSWPQWNEWLAADMPNRDRI